MKREVGFWTEYPFAKPVDTIAGRRARIFGDSDVEPIMIRDLVSGGPGVVVLEVRALGSSCRRRWRTRAHSPSHTHASSPTDSYENPHTPTTQRTHHMFMFCAGKYSHNSQPRRSQGHNTLVNVLVLLRHSIVPRTKGSARHKCSHVVTILQFSLCSPLSFSL
jgi:hypothetical protein